MEYQYRNGIIWSGGYIFCSEKCAQDERNTPKKENKTQPTVYVECK